MDRTLTICITLICLIHSMLWAATNTQLKVDSVGAFNPHQLKAVTPELRPKVSEKQIRSFAQKAVVSVYTYNHSNARTSMKYATRYFTQDGWDAFAKALKDSGNLERVVNEKMTVFAQTTDRPIIVAQGLTQAKERTNKDEYVWLIEVPVLTTYVTEKDSFRHHMTVTCAIVQETIGSKGTPKIGIAQFVAEVNETTVLV